MGTQPVELPYNSQGVICLSREIVRKERKEASDEWSMVFWDLVKEARREGGHDRGAALDLSQETTLLNV